MASESDADIQWVLTRIDPDSGVDFAYSVIDANAQSTIKEQYRKYYTNVDHQVTFLQTKVHTLHPIV